MWYRRWVYYALLGAIVVLPVWLLIGRGILATDSGWDFLVYVLLAPLLGLVLAIVAVVTWARASVRRARAVSVLDAIVLSAWYAVVIGYGFASGDTLAAVLAVLAVVLALVAFWSAVLQLARETQQRMRAVMSVFDRRAYSREGYDAAQDPGPVIRLDPPDERG